MEKNIAEGSYLPILLLDNFFIFPSCKDFLNLEKKKNLKKILADSWKYYDGKILIVSSKDALQENDYSIQYDSEKFFEYGSLAKIETDFSKDADLEVILDSLREIQITGLERVKLIEVQNSERGDYYCSNYRIFRDFSSPLNQQGQQQKSSKSPSETVKKLTTLLSGLLQKSENSIPYLVFSSSEDISDVIDFFIQNNKSLSREFKQSMIEEYKVESRLKILTDLDKEIRKVDRDIKERTNEKIINQQTSAYLREQMSSIGSQIREIEGTKNEKDSILSRVDNEPFPNYVKEALRNEVENYEKTSSYSPEASMIRNYIDWVLALPWYKTTGESNLNISSIKKTLDDDHYGLTKVKERVLEYFAVLQNINNSKERVFEKEENE